MNQFVLIACLSAFASYTAADLSHGYRYNQGHSSGGGNFLVTPVVQQPYTGGYTGVYAGGNTGGYTGGYTGSYNSGYKGGYNGGYSVGSTSAYTGGYTSGYQGHLEPIITKHFYLHTAPEEHDEQAGVRFINVGRPHKNYRVVFIDAASSNNAKAKIIANIAPVEDRTAIYVLSKKTSALDISAEVATQAPILNKPEVFFIKYKTPEEAIHAKHAIQSQYDQLGGSSDVIDEGPIPVSTVVGSLGSGSGGDSVAPAQAYLPAK